MRKHYKNVGLIRDAKKQMEKALDEDTGYVNGNAWDFGSLGLKQILQSGEFAAEEDLIAPHQINVQEPRPTVAAPADVGHKLAENMMMLNMQEENKYGSLNVCGGCGAEDGKNGSELLRCGKCKERKYCGTDCQKAHWKYHKLVCKTMVG
jgi:hypothetical protein